MKNRTRTLACGVALGVFAVLLGGCAPSAGMQERSWLRPERPECDRPELNKNFEVLVNYKSECPVSVSFPSEQGNNCNEKPKGDLPPVCLCAGKNQGLVWSAQDKGAEDPEFSIRFSPFRGGSLKMKHGGKTDAQKIDDTLSDFGPNGVLQFEYTITAGANCAIIDPPIIIKQ
jgi:hypothetical protein